ncbi:hypothetical protein RIVM261_054600 [Rivularia sp. IAM M-261]|nr:hypothetical protein CAL7716_008220 [Calothrix sp. PCC 7716]GJD20504.1 hypothetical protein RIVM261_054600 [Rivularia sp. IAM M-261]
MQNNPSAATPLYTLNPRERFTERASDYVKHRPSYPAEAIDAMSISYVPREGEGHERLLNGLLSLYQKFCSEQGFVDIVYQTDVYILS